MRRSAARSAALALEHLAPPEAIRTLIDFTWNYFLRNPEFLALLHTENLARAKHLKRSTKVKSMHSPFVEMIRTVVRRGVASGDFQAAVDPVQLYISIAALSFFYLSNSATLGVIFGRDLLSKQARDERLEHMVGLVLTSLTGKSSAAVRPGEGGVCAGSGAFGHCLSSSLRANGSRECAPDDRLREAIHSATGKAWIASSRCSSQ